MNIRFNLNSVYMHVLLISDYESDLKWGDAPLTATGFAFSLIYAHSMKEVSVLMSSVKFDLVLYDLAFSNHGMVDNFKQLAAIGGRVPLIVLTDNLGDPVVKEAIKCGAGYQMVKDRMKLSAMAESFKEILLQQSINYN